jgi:hypothetical protein
MSPNGSKSSFRRRHGWLSTLIDIVLAGVCTVLLVFLVGWISRANVSAAKLKTGADNGTGPLAIYVPDDPREQAADGTDVFARWVEINSPTSLLFSGANDVSLSSQGRRGELDYPLKDLPISVIKEIPNDKRPFEIGPLAWSPDVAVSGLASLPKAPRGGTQPALPMATIHQGPQWTQEDGTLIPFLAAPGWTEIEAALAQNRTMPSAPVRILVQPMRRYMRCEVMPQSNGNSGSCGNPGLDALALAKLNAWLEKRGDLFRAPQGLPDELAQLGMADKNMDTVILRLDYRFDPRLAAPPPVPPANK